MSGQNPDKNGSQSPSCEIMYPDKKSYLVIMSGASPSDNSQFQSSIPVHVVINFFSNMEDIAFEN